MLEERQKYSQASNQEIETLSSSELDVLSYQQLILSGSGHT